MIYVGLAIGGMIAQFADVDRRRDTLRDAWSTGICQPDRRSDTSTTVADPVERRHRRLRAARRLVPRTGRQRLEFARVRRRRGASWRVEVAPASPARRGVRLAVGGRRRGRRQPPVPRRRGRPSPVPPRRAADRRARVRRRMARRSPASAPPTAARSSGSAIGVVGATRAVGDRTGCHERDRRRRRRRHRRGVTRGAPPATGGRVVVAAARARRRRRRDVGARVRPTARRAIADSLAPTARGLARPDRGGRARLGRPRRTAPSTPITHRGCSAGSPTGRSVCWRQGLVLGFHRSVDVAWRERLPTDRPVLIVANHGNGFVDPVVVAAVLGRLPRFLAKAALWKVVVARPFLGLAGVLPVYRSGDGDRASNNTSVFDACHRELAQRRDRGDLPRGHHGRPRRARSREVGRRPHRPRCAADVTRRRDRADRDGLREQDRDAQPGRP